MEQKGEIPHGLHLQLLWMMDKETGPGWSDIRQNRGCHTFYWIREGRGTFVTEEGEELPVREGMLFYLRPGLHLHMTTDDSQPLRIAMVLVLLYQTERDPLGGMLMREFAEALPLPFMTRSEGEADGDFEALFEKLLREWIPGQADSELAVKALLFELLHRLNWHANAGSPEENGPNRLFARIRDELARQYAEPVPLREWTRRFGISESYLRSLFMRFAGQGPKSYLARLRNEHAKRMLVYTDRTMKEIAESCGFADEFHFSKSFKKENGMPPKAYRQQAKSEETARSQTAAVKKD
ncbi:helix-turn-helix transcriptional regulator [Paenibacillus soyae]|uniref:AraC family transcriptional regulator n=1 Tax=Paenibacillus soyae TaxID=2969249 RepID=A0A9X2MU79_9BACL|nr:AraC family transcriptional regulator [Paenibacillus soyae]